MPRPTTTRRIIATFRCRGTDSDLDRYKALIKRLGRQYGLECIDHRTEPPLPPVGGSMPPEQAGSGSPASEQGQVADALAGHPDANAEVLPG